MSDGCESLRAATEKGTPVITARGLRRNFKTKAGPVEAVKGIDLDVAKGEIVGLLGPNGAGKTTTLRMLTTLLTPSAGTATVAGPRPAAGPARGAPPDRLRRPGRLRAVGRHQSRRGAGHPGPAARAVQGRCDCSAGRAGTGAAADRPRGPGPARAVRRPAAPVRHRARPDALTRSWSSSTSRPPASTRRAGPTCGSTSARCATASGVTVVLTTHYLDEADALADRILVMDHGTVIANDTPEALKASISGDVVTIVFDELTADARDRAVAAAFGAVEVRAHVVSPEKLDLTVEKGDVAVAPLLRALRRRRHHRSLDRGQPAHPRRRLPHPDRPRRTRGGRPCACRPLAMILNGSSPC